MIEPFDKPPSKRDRRVLWMGTALGVVGSWVGVLIGHALGL